MHAKTLLALSLMTITASSAFSEPLISPEVHPDRSVTFRLKAPDAKEVLVRYDLGTNTLQRDEQGVWSVTTEPLEPDIYSYSFLVDGLRINDPANSFLKYSLIDTESQVHVAGPATLPWKSTMCP